MLIQQYGFLSKLHGSALTAIQAEPSRFPNWPANLFVFAYTFFFFETWRIVIRQFQVVWLPEDNTILEPLGSLYTMRQCNSQGYDYLFPALLHAMSISSFVFTVQSYIFFNLLLPIMSIQPYNHTKNTVKRQSP